MNKLTLTSQQKEYPQMLLFESICKGHLRHWFIRNFSKLQDIDTLCYVAVNKEIGFSDIIISLVSRTARTAVKGYCNDGLNPVADTRILKSVGEILGSTLQLNQNIRHIEQCENSLLHKLKENKAFQIFVSCQEIGKQRSWVVFSRKRNFGWIL